MTHVWSALASVRVVLHVTRDPVLSGVLAVSALASLAVVTLAAAAFVRRRSPAYLLVALALTAFLGRTLIAAATLRGVLPYTSHHLLEHTLDLLAVALLLAAVYLARRPTPRSE